jgi:CRISPR-associated endonuclease/helicase Cas3
MDQAAIFPHAWGKVRRRCPDAWPDTVLALADHAADVAAVAAALLDLPSVQARLRALAGAEITEDQRAAMVGAAFLHDIGKANRGFWRKQIPPAERGSGPIAGHVREAAPLLFRPLGGRPIVIAEAGAFLKPATPAGMLLLAALGHHGEPAPWPSLKDEARCHAALWQPAEGYDPVAEARALCRALAAWLPESLRAAERLPPLPAPLLHGFAGLLSGAPAHAGMDLACADLGARDRGCPRPRGDGQRSARRRPSRHGCPCRGDRPPSASETGDGTA